MAPAAARRRGGDGAAVLRQGFAKLYGGGGGVGEGEGGTKGQGKKSSILPTIYRRPKGGGVQHTYGQRDVSSFLIQQREGEVEEDGSSSSTTAWW